MSIVQWKRRQRTSGTGKPTYLPNLSYQPPADDWCHRQGAFPGTDCTLRTGESSFTYYYVLEWKDCVSSSNEATHSWIDNCFSQLISYCSWLMPPMVFGLNATATVIKTKTQHLKKKKKRKIQSPPHRTTLALFTSWPGTILSHSSVPEFGAHFAYVASSLWEYRLLNTY